ncbi:unnamed protein product [Nyctereutes procyonoides]|uniref:(raccoon dog) hypothetical protein n=1 Tax=Nyctereutes procyonoides TaxID=34880 RepID=A0A811YP02_NYCPR|nr:unnamed protein product [Nyctereutes procyonoides]CAD7688278.1 unnamed protein product [Nyctereutes procyonoides]
MRSTDAQEQYFSAKAERINSPFLCLFVQVGPSTEWITLVRAIFITQSCSNTNLFWKHPHKYELKQYSISYLGIP